MRLPRFFAPFEYIKGGFFVLPDDVARHLSQVLRLKVDEEVILFNGDNHEYLAKITEIQKKKAVTVKIIEKINRNLESPLKIHLIQSISKGERMDWALQKATELGVYSIYPVVSERTNVSLQGERLEKKMNHWRGIISSACEQCGRNTLAKLQNISQLDSLEPVFRAANTGKFVLSPDGEKSLSELDLQSNEHVYLAVGPEGGFSENELSKFKRWGFWPLKMGERTLRTETATVVGITLLQAKWGDIR